MLSLRNCRVGVVGLGYVGLPLAIEFGKHFVTIGFDIRRERISELRAGRDSTLEIDKNDFRAADKFAIHIPGAGSQELYGVRRYGADTDR